MIADARSRSRLHQVIGVAMCCAVVAAACTSSDDDDSTAPVSAAPVSTETLGPPADDATTAETKPGTGTSFEVEALGLTFVLPESFGAVDDPDYLFLARSASPRSLFSVMEDVPSVATATPEGGEVITDLELDGVKAVVVTDAVLEGLPDGISANELLVSNGDESFSVIMSGETEALPELWDQFVRSVAVTPTD